MEYFCLVPSPPGEILLISDGEAITGLYFSDRYSLDGLVPNATLSIFSAARDWLRRYFLGEAPDPGEIPIRLSGSTFAMSVWAELRKIPYGTTVSYGEIAKSIGCRSAQAVGGAVGRNPISIIVPCHRVLGVNGALTGYAGGLQRKIALLNTEKIPYKT